MNNYGGEMKKYTVIGLEVLVSAIFIIAIVIPVSYTHLRAHET